MSDDKRVALVCSATWTGGPTIFLRRACEHLPEFGWSCKLVLTGSRRHSRFDLSNWPSPIDLLQASYSWPMLAHRLGKAIANFRPHVVVATAMRGAPLAMRYLYRNRISDAPFVDTIMSDTPGEYRRLWENSDIVTAVGAVSATSVQRVQVEVPHLDQRVGRIYFPVPCACAFPEQRSLRGPIRLIYIGMLRHHEKRVLDLVPLTAELLRRGVDFTLTIVGDGADRQRLRATMGALPGAESKVQFLGWLPSKETVCVLANHHVLLLVSEVEGQSIAMLEAMGGGIVPVVSDLPGLRELVSDGRTGFLVPVGDTAQFAARVAELAAAPERLDEIGRAAWGAIRGIHENKIAVGRFADFLERSLGLPRPKREAVRPANYGGRMQRWGIPDLLQGAIRRCFGREIH